MDAYESTIQKALEHIENHPEQSVRSTAAAYNLSEATLRRRRKGATDRHTSHELYQRLSLLQEEFLVDWILEQDQHGYPPSHARAREMAARILLLNGDTAPLGNRWIQKFIKRNPRVASVIGRKIKAAIIHGTSQEAMQGFYTLFKQVQG